jgi:DNA polymerase/3'-5' exonuclease PolX
MFEIRLDNKAGSTILQEMAFLLELKGENPFKVKAYSNLQFTISNNHSRPGRRYEKGNEYQKGKRDHQNSFQGDT